jgi:hypothetical protein
MAANVDDPAARALRVLLGASTSALTEGSRAAWTRFILAALHRRPAAVAEIGARIAERFVYGRTTGHLRFVANRLGRTPSRLLGSAAMAGATPPHGMEFGAA